MWSDQQGRRTAYLGPMLALAIVAQAPSSARAGVKAADVASWPIVVAADAPPGEKRAARELGDAFAEAVGKRPEVVADRPAGPAVVIGKASGLKTEGLGDEGFTIRVGADRVAIAGGSPRGTLYGVYSFLEDEYGVRYLTADATSVPRVDPAATLADGERTFRPRFAWRHSYYRANQDHPELAARLRDNAVVDAPELGGRSPWSLISHTVYQWVPVAKLGKTNPELFSLVEGRRRAFMADDQFDQGGTQPCFSNPEVRRRIIDGVLAELASKGQTDGVVSISQNDNQQYCRCPACAAIDDREGSHMGSLLALLNEAGEAVAKVRPGVCVGTLAYQHTRQPTRTLKPGPNVAIQLCSIEACQVHPLNDPACERNQSFCRDLDGWCKISDKVYVWNYNVDFTSYNLPCPNIEIIGANVKYLASNGVRGVFMQAAGDGRNTELCDLRNHLISRLLWDPSVDDRRVIDEFAARYYGAAADDVKAYLKLIAETPRKKGVHHHCFGTAADYGYDDSTGREALALLERGMARAESPAIRDRVEKLTVGPRTILLEPFARWVRGHQGEIAAGRLKEAPPEAYRGMEAELRELFRLYERHGVDRYSEGLPAAALKATLPASLFATPAP
ncbi:DUF4838 domain-containing protein [Paludisphaera mucosa]|uniref:DUF4838 domain-containing protein n=1 Tax=Paludisphaera mucosa TaxID=3030827 RepID=A0ABT6FBE5_9BACT|nr:DUF4838 domain-containing protein [Paludisphaera mucosa]MDG3004874.1 DUF4838 domain-containing protein [Paludisphaera mucosa]